MLGLEAILPERISKPHRGGHCREDPAGYPRCLTQVPWPHQEGDTTASSPCLPPKCSILLPPLLKMDSILHPLFQVDV